MHFVSDLLCHELQNGVEQQPERDEHASQLREQTPLDSDFAVISRFGSSGPQGPEASRRCIAESASKMSRRFR
jgi:hypothetical protein